jgi:hypothetical protein
MKPTADVPLYRTVAPLLIAVAVATVCGRILNTTRVSVPFLVRPPGGSTGPDDHRNPWPTTRPEPVPSYGDNDRSRWDTVRALVDHGEYRIGHRDFDGMYASVVASMAAPSGPGPLVGACGLFPGRSALHDSGICTEDGWRTIDKVLKPDTHDFYSSKPPLLPTLVAGEYYLLKYLFGWEIFDDRRPEHDQRWEVMRTILLTVNALPFLIYLVVLTRLAGRFGQTDWGRLYVVAAGAFGTFLSTFAVTFNNHSVAACTALFALYPTLLIWDGRQDVWLYVLAGFFAGFTVTSELPAAALAAALFGLLLLRSPGRTLLAYVPAAAVPLAALLLTNYLALGQLEPAYEKFGSPWYEYEGSHWRTDPGEVKFGIDWAYLKEGRGVYGFHVLLGHHGLFSLTPVFLLAVAGAVYLLVRRRGASAEGRPGRDLRGPALVTLLVSAVVIGFYVLWVSDRNRNYGGWSVAPRWLIWLTPLLLVTMLPAADRLARRRWGRGLGLGLLALSVLSASYPAWSPWWHPWIYNWLEYYGWLRY